ncbi:MAG: hypothetical protein H0W46_11550, partial [Acidimicrobiia bacterium]|nr:hypothetical protein [Acidimicrobiia bacterium]
LPVPGAGATAARHRRLYDIARADVAVARLAEAHADALAILGEAGRAGRPGCAYGVWAADDPSTTLELRAAGGGWRLDGAKTFCTGAGIVSRALVTVRTSRGVMLADVDLQGSSVEFDTSAWIAAAFSETRTARATFRNHLLDPDDLVGAPGWYLDRVGFWHGACGPAACWAGGAAGLVDWMLETNRGRAAEPHRDAHVGALAALRWRMAGVLDVAGREIDGEHEERKGAHERALMLRHDVERAATEVIERIGRAMGPRPLAFDAPVARRIAEVQLYVRQSHAERDLAELGRLLLEPPAT